MGLDVARHCKKRTIQDALRASETWNVRASTTQPKPRQVPRLWRFSSMTIFSRPDMTNTDTEASPHLARVKTMRGRAAAERLNRALLEMASRRLRTHCSDYGADLWTSDKLEERREAARLCQGCPVQTECLSAAQARREKFGVYGGKDMTPNRKEETE
jgi:hypothetical protein